MERILKISQEDGGKWQVGCQETGKRNGEFHYGHTRLGYLYKDRWLKKALRPECRLCGQASDAIRHIISECRKLASTDIEYSKNTAVQSWQCCALSALQDVWITNRVRKKKKSSAAKERC